MLPKQKKQHINKWGMFPNEKIHKTATGMDWALGSRMSVSPVRYLMLPKVWVLVCVSNQNPRKCRSVWGSRTSPAPSKQSLTQAHVEHVLHGVPGFRVEDAATHAQPDDGHLGNHAAQKDAQVAAAVVYQV